MSMVEAEGYKPIFVLALERPKESGIHCIRDLFSLIIAISPFYKEGLSGEDSENVRV